MQKPDPFSGHEAMFRAGFQEFADCASLETLKPIPSWRGAERAMKVAMLKERENSKPICRSSQTVGSTSPYIGCSTVMGHHALLY